MVLSEQLQRELNETLDEIAQLEHSQRMVNGLGVSNSSNGISSTFRNPEELTKRLSFLRNKRNQLENLRDGKPVGTAGIGVLRANYWGAL